MLAGLNRHQTKTPAQDKPKGVDIALDGKDQQASNPVWQSLALRSGAIQAKLAVSQPDDPYEQEADRVADRVMRMATSQATNSILSLSSSGSLTAQRKCAPCEEEEEEEKLQRKEESARPDSEVADPHVVHQALASPGQPLDSTSRAFFEPRFGLDFSQVRVHDDARAASSAEALNASAYTLGSHIVFAAGAFSPNAAAGQRLLAHELVHTAQQNYDPAAPRVMAPVSGPDDAVEREKNVAPGLMERRSAFSVEKGASDVIHLKPEPQPKSPPKPKAPAKPKVPVTVDNVDDLYGALTEDIVQKVFTAYGSRLIGNEKELISAFAAEGLSAWLGLAIVKQESSFANEENTPSIDERNVANPFSVHFNTNLKRWPKGCGKNLLLIEDAGKEYTPGKDVKKECATKDFRLSTFEESAKASAKTMARLGKTKKGIDAYREEGGYKKDLNGQLRDILNKIKLEPK